MGEYHFCCISSSDFSKTIRAPREATHLRRVCLRRQAHDKVQEQVLVIIFQS